MAAAFAVGRPRDSGDRHGADPAVTPFRRPAFGRDVGTGLSGRHLPVGADLPEVRSYGQARMAGRLRYGTGSRSEEHTSELQSLMRISYAVFCLKKKKKKETTAKHYNRQY